MDKDTILKMTALEAGAAIKAGQTTSEEITKVFLDKIAEDNAKFNSYITVCDDALEQARKADEEIKAGKLTGALAGVPIAIKDNICTKGVKTTCASKMLGNFVPPYDATVIKKIKAEGMVILGKTNMDEFAMGSTTETSFFGPTLNPWGENRVPGGSHSVPIRADRSDSPLRSAVLRDLSPHTARSPDTDLLLSLLRSIRSDLSAETLWTLPPCST